MVDRKSRRPDLPAGFLPRLMLPFAVPIVLTLLLLVLFGERWPRTIAPGSGLKLAGLCATACTAGLVWYFATRRAQDGRVRKFAAVACAVTGLIGWPVWSAGFLPSVNGAVLGPEQAVPMILDGTEITSKSKSRDLYYWASLRAGQAGAPIASGRYFIPEETYREWGRLRPKVVQVRTAPGLLGAMVVTGYGAGKEG